MKKVEGEAKLHFYIVDAFADQVFAGNPAGVCPVEAWPSEPLMKAIAAELNQTETAFIATDGEDYRIRWFTPTREVDHIGHATLAAGFVIMSKLDPTRKEVRFQAGDSFMIVRNAEQGASIDMPAIFSREHVIEDQLVQAIGLRPKEVLKGKHYLAVLQDIDEVRSLRPNFDLVAGLSLPGVIVTARGDDRTDFVSRFFAPANGVPEDPVSGVSHCALAPFWSQRLKKSRLLARQMSRRGGTMTCEFVGDRVILEGNAIVSAEGYLHLSGSPAAYATEAG